MRSLVHPLDALAGLHGYLFPWLPVCLGIGIATYFTLQSEPAGSLYIGLAALWAGLALLWLRGPVLWRPLVLGLLLGMAGFGLAGARTFLVAAPVLGFQYYGPIEGRVLLIDRSASDQMRITLDRVVLERTPPGRTPHRVRVSLGGDQPQIHFAPGQTVMLTGFLSPAEGPAEPGGFDFQRMAWYLQLGAVGFSRSPVMALEPPDPGQTGLWFARLRQSISDTVRARYPDDAGGFVTAILTNDISGISRASLASLRASNLAHLLSVSGLHMALLTGFVFTCLRSCIALIPPLALRVSSKKIAALVGLLAAAFYLGLSGSAVATQRSFIMVAVMLVAVLVDRRAISLRSVAIAALIVLVLEPESLTEPGFQMSFAATIALVAAFTALRDRPQGRWHPPRWMTPVLTLLLSSAVAGAATAPFGAAHFNRISGYGMLANMVAVPVMGMVVMPAAVFAAALAPFGLAGPALWAMQQGSRLILLVSDTIAGLGGSVVPVVSPPGIVLPLLALGGLWLILLPGRIRWGGAGAMVAALGFWALADRPSVLIADSGGLVGVLAEPGRGVSRARGEGFAAASWLENDGDLATQPEAYARGVFSGTKGAMVANVGGLRLVHLTGAGVAEVAAGFCDAGSILVVSTDVPGLDGPCRVFDPETLSQTGAVALRIAAGAVTQINARDISGQRLWNMQPVARRKPPDSNGDTVISGN